MTISALQHRLLPLMKPPQKAVTLPKAPTFSGRQPDDSFTYGREEHTDPHTGKRYITMSDTCGAAKIESSTPVDEDGNAVDEHGNYVEWSSQRGGWVPIDMTK